MRARHVLLFATSLAVLIGVSPAFSEEPAQPHVFMSNPAVLAQLRQRALANDPALNLSLERLKQDADKSLKQGPWSVTQKKHPSPTGDPHDYISLAPYFWPNPDTKDGLPYVRHDGRRNPEIREYDAANFGAMSSNSYTLAMAYYMTGNEAYAEHAALVLRTWFLDPATRMNPNLEHAQLVKGLNDGRGTGIIESARLLDVVDAAGLLAGSKAWTAQDQTGLENWFRDYVKWMRESKRGRDEAAAKNNHGTWYDVQAVTYLLFVGDEAGARSIAESAKKRLDSQIEPDGSMPLELARTKSFSYSVFNLKAMTQLADLARRVDVDLWDYKTPKGVGIRAALDYLLPHAIGENKWEHQQIGKFSGTELLEPLRRAAAAYHDPKYKQAVEKLAGEAGATDANAFHHAF